MRRRPIILLLLAMAALAGAALAFADAPSTSVAWKALAEVPDAQVGPALAVNPTGGLPNIDAAIVGTDFRNGAEKPISAVTAGSIVASGGATTWTTPQATLPHSASDVSFGSPDIAWGPGNKVYAVEVGRDTDDPTNPCLTGAGIYLFVSSDEGASWGAPLLPIPGSANQAVFDPSIAYDPQTGRIYIAYTTTNSCTATPGAAGSQSFIKLTTLTRDDGVGGTPRSPVDPGGPNPQFVRPSVAVLPGGYVEIAYYDSAAGRVLATNCTPPTGSPSAPSCLGGTVTVDDSAKDPGSINGLQVHVSPRIATDTSGRAVVTWAELIAANNVDVFSATSRASGTTFGPPQVVSGDPSNQIDPSIAITPAGRADIAFLDSRYDSAGYRVAVSASYPPSGSSTTETWSTSVAVEGTTITPVAPTAGGLPSLGAQVGVAEIPARSPSLPPWTLVAWTDTRNVTGGSPHNEDVYSTVLLHGATPPSGPDKSVDVQRNIPSVVGFAATDNEADPLKFSIAQQGVAGTAAFADPNVPAFTYSAPPRTAATS